MHPHYPYPEWEHDEERYVYLGTERNPRSKMIYDYWLVKTSEADGGWSPTARHGIGDGDYGSTPLCMAYYNDSHLNHLEDYIFGLYRARQLSLYYLATGEMPLREPENGPWL